MPTIYNKVELDGDTLLDLSQDTVASASHIRQGYVGHLNDGSTVTGTYAGASPTIQSLTVTPSTSQQTFNEGGVDGYKPVTVDAMPSGTATAPTTISGTAATVSTDTNTLTLSKTVSVTPRITTAGYISAGTAGNSEVSLTANVTTKAAATITPTTTNQTISSGTYLTGAQTISGDANLVAGNIKKDVQIFGVTGNYEGGSGSDVQVGYAELYSASTSALLFTGLQGEPTSFIALCGYTLTPSATPQVAAVVYDGTNLHAQTITNTNNAQVSYASTGFSYFYNSGALQVESTGSAVFDTSAINSYVLFYTYDGTSGNIHTADVQVGSGATSITFTGLEDEPLYWSCIFKSNFSTSSGYQRVITTAEYDGIVIGYEMDSSAHSAQHWTSSYSGGSLTISSNGTNQGGYFHQPGYYQLTYAVSGDQTLQTKTVTPTTSTQNVTADTAQGYTALKKVVVKPIPSSYVQPTSTVGATTYRASTSSQSIASGTYHSAAATIAAVSQTNLAAENIKSGTTITISNGQSDLWSVTGTYTGGGGSSDVVMGTLNVASNVNTSTSTQITTTSAIGFTPTKFFFFKSARTATSNHVHQATFTTMGSYYIRTMTRYSSNALSTSGNTNNWTTQTAGYLYYNSNTIYFRSSSSYILSSGTWYWVAVK